MSYVDQDIDQRAEVLCGSPADSLVYWAKTKGLPATLDAAYAFVTLSDNGGGQIVARVAATQAANGQLSFSQAWPEVTWQLQEDAIALWEWKIGGVVFTDRQYFDVVRNKLFCPIDTSKLLEVYPDLELHLSAIGETDVSKFIKRAWSKFLHRIRSGHNRPSLILDKSRLVEPALELTLYMCCRALSRNPEDVWDHRKKEHREDYIEAIAGLGEVKYDRNEDGIATQGEDKALNRRNFSV